MTTSTGTREHLGALATSSRDADDERAATILRPLGALSRRELAVLVLASLAVVWFLQAWAFQLRHGLVVTGLSDWGTGRGAPWGLYVGSFIWWVGIAHGGIIVSAAVRLFRLEALRPVARLAEILTLAALAIAGLYIILHVGRPERIVTSILPNLGRTISTSPLAWDVTVITLYFVLTGTYLILTIRHDLDRLRGRLPRALAPLYRLVLVGHRPGEEEKARRMAWWLALGLIVLAPLFLHGGVIPWLFALLPGQPGWFGPVQGPLFLAAALTSALGAVTLLAYVFRRGYGWERIVPDSVFASLSRGVGLFALVFLWLQLQLVVTGSAMPPEAVGGAVAAKTSTPWFWLTVTLLGATVLHAAVQAIAPRRFRVRRTVVFSVLPLVAILVEKTLFVVEGLMHPAFGLYDGLSSSYLPSWVELSSVVGAIAIVTLVLLAAAKSLPLVELEEAPR